MSHVFVSSSSNDKQTAQAVCEALEKEGIKCWIAPRNILPGMEWGEAIVKAIRNSQAIVLIFSAHSNRSSQVKREVERAVHREVPIIVFRVEDVEPEGSLEYYLSAHHWLDAIEPPADAYLPILAEDLKAFLEQRAQDIPLTTQSFRLEVEKEADILEIEPSVEIEPKKEADTLEIEPSVEAESEKETEAPFIIEGAKEEPKEEAEDEVVEAPLIIESAKDEPEAEVVDEEAPLIIESPEEDPEEKSEVPLFTESFKDGAEEEAEVPLIIESFKEEPIEVPAATQTQENYYSDPKLSDEEAFGKKRLLIISGIAGASILVIILLLVATSDNSSNSNSFSYNSNFSNAPNLDINALSNVNNTNVNIGSNSSVVTTAKPRNEDIKNPSDFSTPRPLDNSNSRYSGNSYYPPVNTATPFSNSYYRPINNSYSRPKNNSNSRP